MINLRTAKTVNRIICAAIAAVTMSTYAAPSFAADADASESGSTRMLKGQLNYVVPQGTNIKLKLATVPTMGMHLLDRDLDGELIPAKLDQEITAKTSEDIYVDDNKVIPEGTIFHGRVSKIEDPKRVNRNGSLQISFDAFKTPDGRVFEFHVEADNKKASTNKTKAKRVGYVLSYSAGGAIVGALVAYQIFGLHNTIAMHGYNIAGGAAGGAILATTYALMKKGKKAVLEPGDDLNMQIDSDLLMPAAVDPAPKKLADAIEGLKIDVSKTKLVKDGLEGHLLKVDMLVSNNSDEPLNSIDAFVEDSNGNRNPICSGAEDTPEDSEYIFTVEPHTEMQMRLNFQIEYPKLKRHLVWLKHDSRQVCYRAPLP